MKYILILLFPLLIGTMAYSQSISYEDFKTVIPFLQKEDYKGAFEMTNKLLNTTQNDSSDIRGIVTYMNIFSAAGMVSEDKMSFDDFSKNANKYVGQYLVMSAHPCVDSGTHDFNSLQFVTANGQLRGMTITANDKKTNILCFEYFEYSEPVNPSEFIGKNVRCGGILKAVETNPNKSKIWISRLHISDAFARDMAAK